MHFSLGPVCFLCFLKTISYESFLVVLRLVVSSGEQVTDWKDSSTRRVDGDVKPNHCLNVDVCSAAVQCSATRSVQRGRIKDCVADVDQSLGQ